MRGSCCRAWISLPRRGIANCLAHLESAVNIKGERGDPLRPLHSAAGCWEGIGQRGASLADEFGSCHAWELRHRSRRRQEARRRSDERVDASGPRRPRFFRSTP